MGGLITIRCCVTEISTDIAVAEDYCEDQPEEERETETFSTAATTVPWD